MTYDATSIQCAIAPILRLSSVRRALLFGSHASGTQTAQSDVDLLVSYEKPISLLKAVALERALTEALGRRVDLVSEGGVSPYLKADIMQRSVLVYEK